MNPFTALSLAVLISATMLLTSAAQDTTSTNTAGKPPMVTKNPDGTFTVRKEPAKGQAKDPKAKEGLVIPAQVVVPIFLVPEKKQ
ncbi:MAG: hypothetical protein WCA45_11840 [Thiobacillaceae bacterium]